MSRILVGLGGNALLRAGSGTHEEQLAVIRETARHVVAAIDAGHEVVLTHGNGPQVGARLLQQESAPDTPQSPLDVLVAETQAGIGYLLQQALDGELAGEQDFLTVVTQVVVDPDDPAFEEPTKPVGPRYTESEARERPFETRTVDTGERPYRRVVPSPPPVEVVESEEIAGMVDRGSLVICGGGGGVPVVREGDRLRGIECVVDKDLTSELLARDLDADLLVLLTDVPHAYTGYGTDDQTPIHAVDATRLRGLLDAGEFGEGSMEPKMAACASFVDAGGERAVVTTPEHLAAGIRGETGTQVYPPGASRSA